MSNLPEIIQLLLLQACIMRGEEEERRRRGSFKQKLCNKGDHFIQTLMIKSVRQQELTLQEKNTTLRLP